jgi:peptidoglycan hydrolase-like protein with peptidoglycan-binding domain
MNNKELLLERILLNMKYDSRMTLSENMLLLENDCTRYQKVKDLEILPDTGSIQQYLKELGFNVAVDYSFGNGTATAVWTHFFGSPGTTKTPTELWTELKNKGYSVGTTPGIGYQTLKVISDKLISIRNNKLKNCITTKADAINRLGGLTPGSKEWADAMRQVQIYNSKQDTGCPPNMVPVTDSATLKYLNTEYKNKLDTRLALMGTQRSTTGAIGNYRQNSKGGWCELKNYVGDEPNIDVAEEAHAVLTIIELGTLAAAMIPTPLSPILFGISMAAGLADAGVYFAEGDKYMGSMMLALEVIPGGELLEIFAKGGGKIFKKIGKEGTEELLEKGAKETLTATEKTTYKALKQEIEQVSQELVQGTEKQIVKNVTEKSSKTFIESGGGVEMFFDSIYILWKSIGKLPQMAIKVGGTMWGIDQLYLALYGRDEDRQKSDIRKLYYWIQSKGLPENQEFARVIKQVEQSVAGGKVQKDVVMKNISEVPKDRKTQKDEQLKLYEEMYGKNVRNKKPGYAGSGREVELPVPTVEEVLSGSKYYTFGMKGDEIYNLKSKLKTNYGNFNQGLDKTLQNNEFDDEFLNVIIDFQENIVPRYYDTKITDERAASSIGNETYKFIMMSPLSKMKTITTQQAAEGLTKDDYDYFVYQPRIKQYTNITYEDYLEQQKAGNQVKKELKQKDLQVLNTPDPTKLSRKERRNYFKNQEQAKKWIDFYKQKVLLQTITPEQRQALEDLSSLPLR